MSLAVEERWCAPPPPHRSPTRPPREQRQQMWTELIVPAMQRPGKWYLARDDYFDTGHASCAAQALRSGRQATDRPAGGWEFRAGALSRGARRFGVWVRFTPIEPTLFD